MNRIATTVATLSLLAAQATQAAPVSYAFDTVTGIDLNKNAHSVAGVLRNTSAPFVIGFTEQTSPYYQFIVNRCVPAMLLAMEKPGRYILTLTIDSALSNAQLISCGLQLKT